MSELDKCAKAHFNAISKETVRYYVVKNFKDLMDKIMN